jgi:cold shock CspA family protein
LEGTIHLFFHQKGYGFVENEAGRWFFSGRAVLGESVVPGDNVTFSLDDDPVRPGELKAVDIQKVGSSATPDPCRLFIANLPYSASEAELSDCFGQFGAVAKVEIIRDSETGESRGFGFVQMENPRAALNCIARLHGIDWDGRQISVRQAEKPKRQLARRA